MSNKALVITLYALAVVLGVLGVAFAFGTPQAPISPTPQVAAAPADGAALEPDPSSPLAIQIPGCVCHSDDPALVEEHAEYRMNQCFGCHGDGMPEMAQ